ncbi:hypothetical protein H4217_006373 [Coemansia sp. RSA 1939]|nr:hypothetical protein H4217_006373 [Coemansia sp. RSA 1939]KAJ2605097.1 hypothetical protein EV177_006229 [Coemansia sp. RSA 1804]
MECKRKVVLAPRQQSGKALQQLRLPNPRTSELGSYYVDVEAETILEAVRVDMKGRRSWLAGDWAISDGSATVLSAVDPLFVYLGLLTRATMSSGDSEWRFVDIDNMLLESHAGMDAESVRVFFGLPSARARALETLCVVRRVSSDTVVVKIDADKVVAWLRRKCEPSGDLLPPAVASLLAGGAVGGQAAGAGAREMALLVSEYLSEYWATRLLAEYGGSVDNGGGGEKTVVFDAPESYVQGVASSKAPVRQQQQQQQQQEKPKTAKEKQLEKAAKKSKSITSFFQKKAAAP